MLTSTLCPHCVATAASVTGSVAADCPSNPIQATTGTTKRNVKHVADAFVLTASAYLGVHHLISLDSDELTWMAVCCQLCWMQFLRCPQCPSCCTPGHQCLLCEHHPHQQLCSSYCLLCPDNSRGEKPRRHSRPWMWRLPGCLQSLPPGERRWPVAVPSCD